MWICDPTCLSHPSPVWKYTKVVFLFIWWVWLPPTQAKKKLLCYYKEHKRRRKQRTAIATDLLSDNWNVPNCTFLVLSLNPNLIAPPRPQNTPAFAVSAWVVGEAGCCSAMLRHAITFQGLSFCPEKRKKKYVQLSKALQSTFFSWIQRC